MAADSQRLDRFLWFSRLTKTRSLAQTLCEAGHIRIDGRRIDRAHAAVRAGNVVSLMLHDRVRVIRIEALPKRRGPAPEARACYTDLAAAEMRTTCISAPDVDEGETQP
jgi:ribosome-associated heat shock protein Hsp15